MGYELAGISDPSRITIAYSRCECGIILVKQLELFARLLSRSDSHKYVSFALRTMLLFDPAGN